MDSQPNLPTFFPSPLKFAQQSDMKQKPVNFKIYLFDSILSCHPDMGPKAANKLSFIFTF